MLRANVVKIPAGTVELAAGVVVLAAAKVVLAAGAVELAADELARGGGGLATTAAALRGMRRWSVLTVCVVDPCRTSANDAAPDAAT